MSRECERVCERCQLLSKIDELQAEVDRLKVQADRMQCKGFEATDVEGYRGDDGWMPQIEMSYTDWPPPPVSAGQVMSDLYLDLYR